MVLASLVGVSCVGLYEAANPLTPEAERVRIAPSGQEMSVELAEHCEPVGRTESVMSEHFARLRAAAHDANVAQVLSVASANGRPYRLDVRFWSCPSAKLRGRAVESPSSLAG